MKLSAFHYNLPDELIARYPLPERSSSRLLVLSKAGAISHHIFRDILTFLQKDDLLVFNNTKVIPARLYANKLTGGRVEIMLERVIANNEALVLMKASKSPKEGSYLILSDNTKIEVIRKENEFYHLKFHTDDLLKLLEKIGEIPLPPYLQRAVESDDKERYQTIYAKHQGAVAAPTAGLHFDEALMQKIIDKGVQTAYVTLHVGAGTFQPVRVADISQHKMHKEFIEVSADLCKLIEETKQKGKKVIAVGTTTVRALETAVRTGSLQPYQGDTDIFITPGYQFKVIDKLITNFHLPESTLMMLVSAFAGYDNIMNAYRVAVAEKYRFFSYGDAMLLER